MIENDNWSSLWRRHLDKYLAKPARTGFWIDAHFGRRADSFLELGCGSGRDSVYLAERGHHVVASDQDSVTLEELQRRFDETGVQFLPADAGALDFPDDGFDLVFHNGLWVLFEDDQFIQQMLREQVRVARRYAVIMVHNAENPVLRTQFRKMAEEDDLYDIRFFSRVDLERILSESGMTFKKVEYLKFGGRMDLLYQRKVVKRVVPNVVWPIRQSAVPHLYRLEPWSKIERVACVIHL